MDYIKDLRKLVGHMPIMYPVVSLVIYNNGKILLQRRSDNGRWSLHGGGINLGEKYVDALKREIMEELNIEPINPKLFGIYSGKELFNIYPSGDQVYILNHVFICENFIGNIDFNDDEVMEFKWFDINNLPDNLFPVDTSIINDIKLYFENNREPIIN